MSTLPRLPAKFRGFGNGSGAGFTSQLGNKTYFQPTRTTNSSLSPTSNSVLHSRKPTSVNYQLQGIRDAALKKYEAYNSQLRQMERNFQLEIKRAEQQSTRSLTKILDLISSYSSEITQLNNQSELLKKKIDTLRNRQFEIQSSGIGTMLSPLKNGFDAFEHEFDEALQNINTLFSNLTSRVKTVQKDFDSTKSINQEISNIDEQIKVLQKGLQNNSTQLFCIQEEFENNINCQRTDITKLIQDQMAALRARVENLEQSSYQSLNKSQSVIGDTQTSQYEMREMFTNSMNIITGSFKSKINDSKRLLFDLQQSRFEQIDAIRSRLSKTNDSITKMRKKKLKNAIENQPIDHKSLQPEIDKLTKKVEELECQLNKKLTDKNGNQNETKQNKSVPKNGVRLFYNIDGDDVKVIIVDQYGNVL